MERFFVSETIFFSEQSIQKVFWLFWGDFSGGSSFRYVIENFLAFLSLDSNDISDVRIHFVETIVNLFMDRL